jgi:sodium-dependent dicarboxylate transporter 2/3/5
MVDTRAEITRVLERFQFRSGRAFLKTLTCLVLPALVIWVLPLSGMPDSARISLAIVTLAGSLWISEAIPAFAVALLVIGLQVMLLGMPGGVLASADDLRAWEIYVRPWASPPMWLFFGGLILARAAQRTEIDRWIAQTALRLTGGSPRRLLPALMAITFLFSMFMSNTATCAMMLTVLGPAVAGLPKDSPVGKSLLLGLAFAANLGGMGTIIGTPPNAIGAGFLDASGGISFLDWMALGLPPSILLFAIVWFQLSRSLKGQDSPLAISLNPTSPASSTTVWQRWLTLLIFCLTIGLWMTGSLHGTPTAVVSFIPIISLTMIGVIRAEDIRALNWDVLILLAGGLSLGVGIESSGLATWMGERIETFSFPAWAMALALAYVAAFASNLMSNTAAANILLPIGLVVAETAGGALPPASIVVPVALSCSIAMALPIATPPNALIFASGRLQARDYLPGGLLTLLLGPPLAVFWCLLLG